MRWAAGEETYQEHGGAEDADLLVLESRHEEAATLLDGAGWPAVVPLQAADAGEVLVLREVKA